VLRTVRLLLTSLLLLATAITVAAQEKYGTVYFYRGGDTFDWPPEINVLNPDRVVLAGSLADLLGGQLSDAIADRTLLRDTGNVPLLPGKLTEAALLGAAEHALQPLLDDPRAALRRKDPP